MKHVSYADKPVLVGDDAADTLIEYARALAENGGADTVTLRAVSPDGNSVEATYLLNSSTILMVETTNSDLEPPDNAEVVRSMRDRIEALDRPLSPEAAPPFVEAPQDFADTP